LKLKKKGEAKSSEQPCEDVMTSENNKSTEKKDLDKMGENRVSSERRKKKKKVKK
jgi:hypothetical protein